MKDAEEQETQKEKAWLNGLNNMEPLSQMLSSNPGVKAVLWPRTHSDLTTPQFLLYGLDD